MIPPHSSLTFTGWSPLFGLVAGVGGGARDQPHGRVGAEPCQLGVHLNAVQKGRSVVPVLAWRALERQFGLLSGCHMVSFASPLSWW